jgi:hypothetical protein
MEATNMKRYTINSIECATFILLCLSLSAAQAQPMQQRDAAQDQAGRFWLLSQADRSDEGDMDRLLDGHERPMRTGRAGDRERDHMRGGFGAGPGMPGGPSISEEHMAVLMGVINDVMPRIGQRLEAMKETNPRQYRAAMLRIGGRVRHLVELKQRGNEALYQLEVRDARLKLETAELVHALRDARRDGADDERVETLRQQLRRTVQEHFEVRQAKLEREVAELEQRLDYLREQLSDRAERRDELIESRIDQLAGEDDDLPPW